MTATDRNDANGPNFGTSERFFLPLSGLNAEGAALVVQFTAKWEVRYIRTGERVVLSRRDAAAVLVGSHNVQSEGLVTYATTPDRGPVTVEPWPRPDFTLTKNDALAYLARHQNDADA